MAQPAIAPERRKPGPKPRPHLRRKRVICIKWLDRELELLALASERLALPKAQIVRRATLQAIVEALR